MTKAKRWKPKEGEMYYWIIVDTRVNIYTNYWIGDPVDEVRYRLGNCFKTKREAEAVARKLKGFWKNVREGR